MKPVIIKNTFYDQNKIMYRQKPEIELKMREKHQSH